MLFSILTIFKVGELSSYGRKKTFLVKSCFLTSSLNLFCAVQMFEGHLLSEVTVINVVDLYKNIFTLYICL